MIAAVLMIAYSLEIGSLLFPSEPKNASIGIAVIAFYFLDFAINCVQCSCRSLIVDVAPQEFQNQANAWAGTMLGLGNILGYLMGFLDLPDLFPFFGSTQIKVLCALAILFFSITLCITCVSIQESAIASSSSKDRNIHPFGEILAAIRNLPRPIQSVCNVQFFSWLGTMRCRLF